MYHIIANSSLDGVTSCLILKWLQPNVEGTYNFATHKNFRSQFNQWVNQNDITQFDKVFVLGFDVTGNIDILNHANIVVFDHHIEQTELKGAQKVYSSTARLVYDTFKNKSEKTLTNPQRLLVGLVDDYISFKLRDKRSHALAMLFDGYGRDKHKKFVERFIKGFSGFSSSDKQILKLKIEKYKALKSELKLFECVDDVAGKEIKMISTYVDFNLNDVTIFLQKNFDHTVQVLINKDIQRVYFRRSADCKTSMITVAKQLTDDAVGYHYAASGSITPTFIECLNNFVPYNGNN